MSKSIFGGKITITDDMLPEGEHICRILSYKRTNSFENYDGSPKDNLPKWKNPEEQIAIRFVVAEPDKSGMITHWYNGEGFEKFDDMTDEDIKKLKLVNIDGFACTENKDGSFSRIHSDVNTNTCGRIFSRLLRSLGADVNTEVDIDEVLDAAIANETLVTITVASKEYMSKERSEVTKVVAYTDLEVADTLED